MTETPFLNADDNRFFEALRDAVDWLALEQAASEKTVVIAVLAMLVWSLTVTADHMTAAEGRAMWNWSIACLTTAAQVATEETNVQ